MIECTVMRGFSDAYGSWKTICSLRRILRSALPLAVASTVSACDTSVMRHLCLQRVGIDAGELLVEVARRAMVGAAADRVQVGAFGRARVGQLCDRAPRVEWAPGRDADQRRRLALD